MENTSIKQSKAKVNIIGLLSQKDVTRTIENGVEVLKGSVNVKTSEFNDIPLQIYARAVTNSGKENPSYKSISTFLNNSASIAEVGAKDATVVEVNGADLQPNTYFRDGSQEYNVRYRASFLRKCPEDNPQCNAEFDVEMYVRSVVEETDKEGNETGRAIVKGYVQTYDILEPLELVAPQEIAADVIEYYHPGDTAEFFGDIVNARIVKTETVPVKIGKPKTTTTTTYKNELVINGASEPYDEGKAYTREQIKMAEQVREEKLAEKKRVSESSGNKTNNGFGVAPSTSSRSLPF